LSNYVYRLSDPFAPPPYRAEQSTFHGFVVEVGDGALQALLDAELNVVEQGRKFVPVLPFVVVTYVAIAKSSSPEAPPHRQGWYSENDLMVWMLVAELADDPVTAPRIGWYVPLVWVDHPIAVIEGREGFGYPKNLGTIVIPDDAASGFSTSATLFPGRPDQAVTTEVINTVTCTSGDAVHRSVWTTIEEAVAGFLERAGVDAAGHVFHELAPSVDLHSIMTFVPQEVFLLRQLRSPGTPSTTEVQELLVSRTEDIVFHEGGLVEGAWTVDFPVYPTLDIAGLFGLDGPTDVMFAYRIVMDVTLGIPVR
jgi:hypothetical protein